MPGPASKTIANVLIRRDPQGETVPLVFDSPHSGTIYPDDFRTLVPRPVLRQAEDAFVDELYDSAPTFGATFLAAMFPRSYIDANRSLADMDPGLVEGGWPQASANNRKVGMGSGLIWRTHYPDLQLYDRKLSQQEVSKRIDNFYRPYRDEFLAIYSGVAETFGHVYHVNCHSMPSVSSPKSPEGPGKRRPDIVLGDANGTTCAPEMVEVARRIFADAGYSVTINDPYNGADLIRAHSRPAEGRHSLQIELNRALYMDEERIERRDGFDKLKRTTTALIEALREFVNKRRA